MRAARRILVAAAALAVLGAGVVIALPWTHDLDNQISIKPQEMPIPPPEHSVPTTGRPPAEDLASAGALANPVPADAASVARGLVRFQTFCSPCHGADGTGAGEVVKRGFLAATNLQSDVVRARSDGYLYSYIRNGGIVAMPAYRFGLTPEEAWDVVNYVRSLQAGASR